MDQYGYNKIFFIDKKQYSLCNILTGRIFFTCFIDNNAHDILRFTLAV